MDNLHSDEFELGVEGPRFWTQDTLRRVVELDQALQINPYATDETAAVLHQALRMGEAERRARMAASRATVERSNLYRCTGKVVSDLGRIAARARLEAAA